MHTMPQMALYVITGASSGIGEAAARRLAREDGAELIVVARRAERLQALADELAARHGTAVTPVAIDLTAEQAPSRVAAAVTDHGGRLAALVNNAGARFAGGFGDTGWEVVRRTMAINFDAQVRLTGALLPMLRATATGAAADSAHDPGPAIVNVASTSAIIARPGAAAYSASKAALSAWSDALALEERPHGVHVGLVQPGFIATEGFPQAELVAKRATRWAVAEPAVVADAIAAVIFERRSEVYAPRGYRIAALTRHVTPWLLRRLLSTGAGSMMSPETRST
jgi:short-subunit dehydrogenase